MFGAPRLRSHLYKVTHFMQTTLKNICLLQKKYSSTNTPEMQERGHLIRGVLTQELRDLLPKLKTAFDTIFDDLLVEGSDGIGRKTEAPWVRLFSKAMSPNPREGFYLVIHFAADGSAVFITVGCGSTVWSGGDLIPVSDHELQKRTSWAKSVIEQRWESLSPFNDQISLGAKAALPRTFEKATAIARRIPVDDLNKTDLDGVLFAAAERLGEIYLAQLSKRDVSPGEQDFDEITYIAKPLKQPKRRQGFGLSANERKAVESRAMFLAIQYLANEGYECKDTSAFESFDILASKDDKTIKVEVKGTTSDICDSVLMTKNEVALHRNEKGSTGLVIVSKIKLIRDKNEVKAEGGTIEAMIYWDIDLWTADPIAFQISRVS
jgi:MrcB-like, N-terminal domain/Domain of unknown function (DUF3883)